MLDFHQEGTICDQDRPITFICVFEACTFFLMYYLQNSFRITTEKRVCATVALAHARISLLPLSDKSQETFCI